MKKPLIAVVVVLVLVIAWLLYRSHSAPVEAPTVAGAPTSTVQGSAVTPSAQPGATQTYTWQFKTTEPVKDGDPQHTTVTLTSGGKNYNIGTYDGSCSVSTASQLLANEKAAVVCWFAGGGNEIGVFEENSKLVLKKGDVDEGDAETQGFRGNFTTLFALN